MLNHKIIENYFFDDAQIGSGLDRGLAHTDSHNSDPWEPLGGDLYTIFQESWGQRPPSGSIIGALYIYRSPIFRALYVNAFLNRDLYSHAPLVARARKVLMWWCR